MKEWDLSEALKAEPMDVNGARAMANLAPAITRNAALLRFRREERRQQRLFAVALIIFALAIGAVGFEWFFTGELGPASKATLRALAGGTAMILLLSPFMAYFLEEERKNEA